MSTPNDLPPSDADPVPASTVLSTLTLPDVGFVQLTPDGHVAAHDDAFADFVGDGAGELVGTAFTDLLATVPGPLESLVAGEPTVDEPLNLTLPIETTDGDVVTYRAQFATVQDDAVVGVLAGRSSDDGAPQLNPEHDEETAARAFIALADSLSDGIIVLDKTSQIQYANPAVDQILGYSPDELVGQSKLSIIPERLQEAHLAGINDYLETGERNIDWRYVELPGQHEDGHEVPLGISLNDFFFDGERYFVGLFRDISERKEVEEALRERERQLEELVDELEESNERLEQFAYAASHDLQEPLRMVTSYLQLIEGRYGDDLDEDGREFIDYAVDGAQRMREMIEGLLAYSRIDTRGDPFEPTDLEAVLADVRDDLTVKIEETDARITADALPRVEGDPGQLRQLFQNLIDNAIEYSGDDPPNVHLSAQRDGNLSTRASEDSSAERTDSDGDRWEIRVSDEGVGIDPDDAERVFEVFQSLNPQGRGGGTGIGLALCKRIVERHDGEIWVDSEPGEGATFSFTLPAADDEG